MRAFVDRYGFPESALRRLRMTIASKRPLITTGMIRMASKGIRNGAGPVTALSDDALRGAIYGYATLFAANRVVDEMRIAELRDEATRRAT